MKSFLTVIFDYHHYFNLKLIEIFFKHKVDASVRTLPMFSHCLNAHQIWNTRNNGDAVFTVNEIHPFGNLAAIDNNNFTTALDILENLRLLDNIEYTNSKGKVFSNTVQNILFHICNHFTHHKAYLISNLGEKGIEPIITDYIYYKR